MIKNTDRTPFLDISRAPKGYVLGYCLGTSYTLDVMCAVQLAFNTRGIERDEEDCTELQLLEALEEFIQKAVIFCQSCQIKELPREKFNETKNQRGRVYKLIDSMVQTVNASSLQSAFHPKIWVFKFDPIEKGSESLFRIVVGSRNLTRALDLDVMICLEGRKNLKNGMAVFGTNRIADFFESFQRQSTGRKSKEVSALITRLRKDLKEVQFYPVPDVESITFIPKLGAESKLGIFNPEKYEKMILVSPFLRKGFIAPLNKLKDYVLITGTKDIKETCDLQPGAKREWYSYRGAQVEVDLHAKIYVAKLKTGGSVAYLGSANATNAAHFGDNFEAMVELRSKRDLVQAFRKEFMLDDKGKVLSLFKPLHPDVISAAAAQKETQEQKCEHQLDLAQRWLGLGNFHIDFDRRTRKATIQYENKSGIPAPRECSGYVEIAGCAKELPLELLLKGKPVNVTIDKATFSSILLITLIASGKPKRFSTIAITNLPRRSRLSFLRVQMVHNSDRFFDYIATLIELTPGRGIRRGGGQRKRKGKRPQTPMVRDLSVSFVETLLMGTAGESTHAKIDEALKGLAKKPEERARTMEFVRIWNQYKIALKRYRKNVG